MTAPIDVDIPHSLGREVARSRIAGGIGKLVDFIPGSTVTEHRWDGDVLHFTVAAMGQRVAARLDVLDSHIHAHFELPAFLALFADKIRAKLQKDGPALLK